MKLPDDDCCHRDFLPQTKRLGSLHSPETVICTMRLHYYAPAVSRSYCVGIHNGHGFGSLFAKLFSKVAAKTAAKAAVNVAKSAGKKALTIAAKKGADLAKEVAKEGLKQAAEIGTELATQKINSLAESAIKKNLPPEIVHSIQNIATRGVGAAGQTVKTVGADKVQSLIDKGAVRAENLGNKLIDKGAAKGNQLIDKGAARIERLAPVAPKKKPAKRKKKKKTVTPAKKQRLSNILDEL